MSGDQTAGGQVVMVFDTSAVLAWVLQERGRWSNVDRMLAHPRIDGVLPAPALTETIYKAAELGNTAGPAAITALLDAHLRLEPVTATDATRAGELITESRRNPAGRRADGTPDTLSLGDGLVLAVADRLAAPAVTYDGYWGRFPTMTFRLVNPHKV